MDKDEVSGAPGTRPVISYRQVTLSWHGHTVLEDFSLDVALREKVLLFGRSGSGKSSLLKMPLGFIRPSSGQVLYRGTPQDRAAVWEARREIAYVSQDFELGEGKVAEFFRSALRLRANRGISCPGGVPPGEVMQLLELDGGINNKSLGDISGGERQRVALALALMLGRDIFLLDEPTSALDSRLKMAVVRYLSGLEDATVVAVSHDPTWLEARNFRRVELDGG